MPKPSASSKQNISTFIKPDMPDQDNTVADADVPPLQKRGRACPAVKMDA